MDVLNFLQKKIWQIDGILNDEVHELLNNMKPDVVAIESLFVAKNVMSSLKLAHARGIVIYIFKIWL